MVKAPRTRTRPTVVVPPTPPTTTGMSTKKVISGVVSIVIVGLIVLGAIAFWPKSASRFSDQKAGVILGVGQEDLEKTMADNYDFGMEDGLNRSGVRTVSLDELRDIADEGIRRYSRYVGDPKYREEQEELDRQEIQQQNVLPPQQRPPAVQRPAQTQRPPMVQQSPVQQRPAPTPTPTPAAAVAPPKK